MRILFFGRYNPEYSRNAVLLQGVRLNNVDVIECRVSPSVRWWKLRLLWLYFITRPSFDVMVVAFPGQEVMPLARLLTRKPIIFDAFTSHFEGYVQDRRVVSAASVRGRWYYFVDWLACRLADMVTTDTRAHAEYLVRQFGVASTKIAPVLLGSTMVSLNISPPSEPFVVHFHGSNIPLQGIPIIWDAIRLLRNEPIRFQMFGPFEVPEDVRDTVSHRRHVPFSDLAFLMAGAHICLGIFGTSMKATRVIPNKVYEALVCSRAIVTADTPAIRELLTEADALLVPAGDSHALVSAILRLMHEPTLRKSIAQSGNARLLANATPAIVGARITYICEQLALPA